MVKTLPLYQEGIALTGQILKRHDSVVFSGTNLIGTADGLTNFNLIIGENVFYLSDFANVSLERTVGYLIGQAWLAQGNGPALNNSTNHILFIVGDDGNIYTYADGQNLGNTITATTGNSITFRFEI